MYGIPRSALAPRSARLIWSLWTLVMVLQSMVVHAINLGLLNPFHANPLAPRSFLQSLLFNLAANVIAVLCAATIQAHILHRLLGDLRRRAWVIASLVGQVSFMLVATLALHFFGHFFFDAYQLGLGLPSYLFNLGHSLLGVLCIALLQALVLRRHLAGWRWWIVAWLAAVAVGYTAVVLLGKALYVIAPEPPFELGPILWLTPSLVYGLTLGYALVRLVNETNEDFDQEVAIA